MATPTVEWLEGDPYWRRVSGVMLCVVLAIGVVETLTLLQLLGFVTLPPYSPASPTGALIQVGWAGLLVLNAFVRLRFPTAGPIGLGPDGVVLRGYLRRWTIPRSRILSVDRRGLLLRGWLGGRLVLTLRQSERAARWFHSPNSA
jgi:hypothetical protein